MNSSPQRKLRILLAADGRMKWGLAAAVGSILDAVPASQPTKITVVGEDLPAVLTERLSTCAHELGQEIEFVPFKWPEGCTAPSLEGSRLAYARLMAADLIDDDVCLYIDSDITLLADPSSLLNQARANPSVPLWAVRNYPDHSFSSQIGRQHSELVDPSRSEAIYFNSGFLVINVAYWREHHVGERCFELASKYQLLCHDQDALNLVFCHLWRELPEEWNYQLFNRTDFPPNVKALHYSGRNKPWHCGFPSDSRAPFSSSLARVGWASWRSKPSLTEWLRNSPWRPICSQLVYHSRKIVGFDGLPRR